MITVITARLSKDRTRKHIFPDKVHFPFFSLFTFHLTLPPSYRPFRNGTCNGLEAKEKRTREGRRPSKSPYVGRLLSHPKWPPSPNIHPLTPITSFRSWPLIGKRDLHSSLFVLHFFWWPPSPQHPTTITRFLMTTCAAPRTQSKVLVSPKAGARPSVWQVQSYETSPSQTFQLSDFLVKEY